MLARIQLRRDTSDNWEAANPVLSEGEAGIETNTGLFKIGNGIDDWIDLGYTGSVRTVAVTDANGVSADVANPSTNPVMTFTLGDITPSSVAATGDVTGENLSGTNTGDQTLETITGLLAVYKGGTNSNTVLENLRIMISRSDKIVEADAIAPGMALISDADGLPIASTATASELGYLVGVTSNIQDQIDATASVAYVDGIASDLQDEIDGKQNADATLTALAGYNTNGLMTQTALDTFTGRTLTGVANRTTVTNGDGIGGNPTVDIATTYVGQASITTLGTVATGAWSATPIALTKGGTGATDASGARTSLGLGTLATQNGTFSGTSSGTNTGDQTISLSGDVVGAGTSSFAATIAIQAVTYAKMQNVSATDKLLGRSSAGSGTVEEIPCTAAGRSLIAGVDAAAQRTTLGLGTLATQNGTFSGTSSGTNTGDQTITLTGDVTGSGSSSFAATIAALAVTYAKIQNVSATDKLLGRSTAGPGSIEEITCTVAGRDLIAGVDAAAQRLTLGLESAATLAFSTDGALTANSDTLIPTQKAVKTYVDTAVTGLLDFKGNTDCSTNPNYPAALKGDAYIVSVAGKIGGASGVTVAEGDIFAASADNAGGTQAAVGTSWFTLQHTLAGVLLSANNLSDLTNVSDARTNLGLGTLATQSGTFSGTSSGTNTGDQTITLTGDVTGAGTGSFAATIAAMAVTYAKIQNVSATDKILGRSSSGAGSVEEIACTTAGRAIIDDADASAQRTTLGLGTLATQSGTFSGTSSGTNTGDQTISLTGDVTGSGTGSFAATIANLAVTYAKMQNISATDKLLGRSTAGAGVTEEITCTAAGRTLIAGASASAQRTTLGLGTLATQNGTFSGTSSGTNTGDQTITLTGDVTGTGTGSFAATIAALAVTYAKIQNVSATDKILGRSTAGAGVIEEITCTAAGRAIIDDADASAQRTTLGLGTLATQNGTFSGTSSGTNTGDQTITLTGDVTGSGTGSFAATIAALAVTYAKIQNVSATDKLLGRSTVGAGVIEEITCTAAGRAIIDDADASAQRTTLGLGTLATQSGTFSGTSSGTNTGDQTITLTGDVTGSGTGSFAATIAALAVTYAKIQNVSATDKILGRSTAGAGVIEEITCTASGRSLIAGASASAQRTTLGLGTIATEAETAYALLAGRSGGQTLIGDTASAGDLLFSSTSNSTKGRIRFGGTTAYDQANDRFGVGTATPTSVLHVLSSVTGTTGTPTGVYLATGVTSTGVIGYGTLVEQTLVADTTNSTLFRVNGTIDPRNGAAASYIGNNSVMTIGGSTGNPVNNAQVYFAKFQTGASYTGALTTVAHFFAGSPQYDGSLKAANFRFFAGGAISNASTSSSGNTSGTIDNSTFYAAAHTAAAGVGGTLNNYGALLNMSTGDGTSGTTNNYGIRITGNTTAGDTNFAVYSDSTCPNHFAGNIGLGTTSFGSSMTNGFSIFTGTAPGSNVTDAFQFYSSDAAAGNACPTFRTENGTIIKLFSSAAYTITNVTPDRAYSSTGTTLAEIANVLGTLIADLQLTKIIG